MRSAAASKSAAACAVSGSANIASAICADTVKVSQPSAASFAMSPTLRTDATRMRMSLSSLSAVFCISATVPNPSRPASFMRPRYGAT